MRKITLLLLYCFCLAGAKGQADLNTYIQTYPDLFQFSIPIKYTEETLSVSDQNTVFRFEKKQLSPGFDFQFKQWNFGFFLPTNLLTDDNPQGRSIGLQIQAFPDGFMFNANISKLKSTVNLAGINTEQAIQSSAKFQVAQLWQVDFNPLFIFNKEKFSLRALYRLDESQKRSAGSPLFGLNLNYTNLSNNTLLTETTISSLEAFQMIQSGFDVGYAYSLKLSPKIALSGLYKSNLSLTNLQQTSASRTTASGQWTFTPLSELFLSIAYHKTDFYTALQFNIRQQKLLSSEIELDSNYFAIQLKTGIRLQRK